MLTDLSVPVGEIDQTKIRGLATNPFGRTLYVNSRAATPGDGSRPDTPLPTVVAALNQAISGNGDTIRVAHAHTESIAAAAGWALSKADVAIIGEGRGSRRPTITFTTSTAATIAVTAAGCLLKNLNFTTSIDALARAIHIQAGGDGLHVEDCRFYEGASAQMDVAIDVQAAVLEPTFRRNVIYFPTAGAAHGIRLNSTPINPTVEGNKIYGDFTQGCITVPGGALASYVANNLMTNVRNAVAVVNVTAAGAGGEIAFNTANSSLAAAATKTAIEIGTSTTFRVNENYGSDGALDAGAEKSGVLNPVADS